MWRIKHRATSGFAALLLLISAGCVDLEVQNPNAPDANRVFETPEDVESLIAGAFKNIHQVAGQNTGPGMALSNAAFQHQAPWANEGMEYYARIPRQPLINAAGAADGPNIWNAWIWSYRGIAAVRTGLKSIADGETDLGANDTRARAYGKLMQGIAHGAIAMLYDSGFIYDETMEFDELALMGYPDVLTAALGYLDDAIGLASGATFTLPTGWMSVPVTADKMVELAYTFKAQFRANVARTPTERAAVNWTAVASDASNGVTEDWEMAVTGWGPDGALWEDTPAWSFYYGGWSMMANYVLGMADTSGNYQTWVNSSTGDKMPFYIFTPDTRFPQGGNTTMVAGDVETAQLANPGVNAVANGFLAIMNEGSSRIHSRPDRGTWRWSMYDNGAFTDFGDWVTEVFPQASTADLYFLRAEAEYRAGNMGTVATMVNSTRTLAGLRATNGAGLNEDCVPRLPNGSCGDLWEMLKWEKRLQAHGIGLFHQGWYYDSRGWGDLMEGTFLQLPVIYSEYALLGNTPYGYGGVGGESAAPVGTYGFIDVP
ncbi:hypothetical protein ACFL3B_00715 [Gemmatimonadota bacterium]